MTPPGNLRRQFASDNYAGVCPEVFAAMQAANVAHATSYGNDPWTAHAAKLVRDVFETECEVFFVFNGTSANALSLATICESFHRVICYASNHEISDECGAPGFFAHGITLQGISATHGKLTPAIVEQAAKARTDIHHNKAGAVSITQATELGTVYTVAELQALGATCRQLGLRLHMDGARFANALISLSCKPADMTWRAGIDVLSFGGTKNGMITGEAVVFFDKDLARDFEFRRKQAGQLSSKMRFLAAQWIGLLENDSWLNHAGHANAMAARLEAAIRDVPDVTVLYPRQANAVFAAMPATVYDALLKRGWFFYNDVGPDGAARLMCSWDTTTDDVDALARDLHDLSTPRS